jgi:ribosome-binding protein aMBF1 (putative translation factor)
MMAKKNPKRCKICGRTIKVMIFRGTGYCCENCRKIGEPE